MANLQVKNVPDPLHNRLRRYAKMRKCTLSEAVLEAIERQLARLEFRERLSSRPRTRLDVPAAKLLRDERESRDSDLEP